MSGLQTIYFHLLIEYLDYKNENSVALTENEAINKFVKFCREANFSNLKVLKPLVNLFVKDHLQRPSKETYIMHKLTCKNFTNEQIEIILFSAFSKYLDETCGYENWLIMSNRDKIKMILNYLEYAPNSTYIYKLDYVELLPYFFESITECFNVNFKIKEIKQNVLFKYICVYFSLFSIILLFFAIFKLLLIFLYF